MAAKNSLPNQLRQNRQSPDGELKIVRLKSRSDFLKVRNGARSHERAFVLQLIERHDDDPALRVGFTVTKKIGNAVVRNRIKRRLREALKSANLSLNCAGKDAVIIARQEALYEPFEKLVESISHGFNNARKKPKSKQNGNLGNRHVAKQA